MFRRGMLGDLDNELAATAATPFVASKVRERNGAHVIGTAQGDGDCTFQVSDEIAGPAAQLAQEQLTERECRRWAFGTNDDDAKDGTLMRDEDVHRVAEGVCVEECVTGPEPARLRD